MSMTDAVYGVWRFLRRYNIPLDDVRVIIELPHRHLCKEAEMALKHSFDANKMVYECKEHEAEKFKIMNIPVEFSPTKEHGK